MLFGQVESVTDDLNRQLETTQLASSKIEKTLNSNNYYFLENKGQWDEKVLFMAQSKSLRTWITKNSIVFEQFEKRKNDETFNPDKNDRKPIKAHAVGLEFVDPAKVNVIKGEPGKTKFNFIIGNDKSKYAKGCLQYSDVRIENIYEGIDMKYYFDNGELRYDFIVKPGANPDLIEMEIKGATRSYLKNGDVVMETTLEPVLKKDLKAFQDNREKMVDCEFKLTGDRLKFDVGEYDTNKKLVIDPLTVVRQWFVGDGALADCGVTIDINNNVFLIGYTKDPLFPYVSGSYSSNYDLIVAALDEDVGNGYQINWGTYFGSSGEERGKIGVDDENVYIAGWTDGTNLPTQNPYQNSNNGNREGFISVFLKSNGNLLYSTYFGTNQDDQFNNLDIDQSNGELYLVGSTDNPTSFDNNFAYKEITTQAYNYNVTQGIVTCLSPYDDNGLHYDLKFASLFGGNDSTLVSDIDISQNLYQYYICISGQTKSDSASYYITSGAYNTQNTNHDNLASVSRLDFNGSVLSIEYNTYFAECKVDFNDYTMLPVKYDQGKFYFGGNTTNSIPTENAYKSTYNNNGSGFIAVIDEYESGNDALYYSSYFSGDHSSGIKDIDLSLECHRVVFTGFTGNDCDQMTGIVDPSLSGTNTLVDLIYLHTGVTTYGNSVEINQSSNSFVFTGGHGSQYDSAMSVYKLSTHICPCPCDESWLKIIEDRHVKCDTLNKCHISSYIYIQPYYLSCYAAYKYDIGNGFVGPFPMQPGQISLFDGCIDENDTFYATVQLIGPGLDTCTITDSSQLCEAPCPCPDDLGDILDITLEKGGEGCDSNQCKVNVTWNTEYELDSDCFKYIVQDSLSPTSFDLTNPPTLTLPSCVDQGDVLYTSIKFMRSLNDTNPCIIDKVVMCPVDNDTGINVCNAYCDSTEWEDTTLTMIIGGGNCQGCYMKIRYSYRKACDVYPEVQITGMETTNNGNPNISCDCSQEYLYRLALEYIIKENHMEFEPKQSTIEQGGANCSDIWRVSTVSCWAHWVWVKAIYQHPNPVPIGMKTVNVYNPCNAECCARRLRVCRHLGNPLDTVTIEDLGVIADSPNCDSLYYYPDLFRMEGDQDPPDSVNCIYTCDFLDGFSDTLYAKMPETGPLELDSIFNQEINPNDKLLKFNVTNTNQYLKILLEQENCKNIVIDVFDLQGNYLINTSGELNKGMNIFNINISKLISGFYLYKITIDGTDFYTGKFSVLK
jgi:hypothetical protein